MNASTRIGRDAVALALGAIVFPACVTRTFQHAIEVKRGSTVEEKLAIAKAIVTEQRLARLREELKARLPGTTDQQLARLGLRWNETHYQSLSGGGSGTVVTVAVGIQVDGTFDPQPIVSAAVSILEPEMNAPSGPAGGA